MPRRLTIGISACFFHADPSRPIFTGKTLQYVEQSIAHWVQSQGALALVVPSPDGDTRRGDVTLDDYAGLLDGLVLEGGSDNLWPGSYGEEPLRPEWNGDRMCDEYEIALLRAFVDEQLVRVCIDAVCQAFVSKGGQSHRFGFFPNVTLPGYLSTI